MWKLIDSCWFQEQWCPCITPKGAFFCEIAGALDQVFEGKGGYPVTKGWWRKKPAEFPDQVKRYCPKCSAALPLERPSNQEPKDTISALNYQRLLALGSPKVLEGKVQIFKKKLERNEIIRQSDSWHP